MELYYSFSVLIVLAALFAYLNHRLLKLPSAIGIMVIAIVVSVTLVASGDHFLPKTTTHLIQLIRSFNFTELLMGAMLNFLLFAGGIHINIKDLREQFGPVVIFSTVGVVISTFAVGFGSYYLLPFVGISMPFIYCLLFGALISPTDPVAVLSILKQANVSKSLETKVAGESLFNDGMAVVVFSVVLQLAAGGDMVLNAESVGLLLLREAGGGLLLGVLLGWSAVRALRVVDDYIISVLITLAVVMGGYLIAHGLHISAPLAMVAAGLFLGNFSESFKMKSQTQDYLIKFWELIDEIMNAVLFLFIGFELLLIRDLNEYFVAGAICILIVLIARWIAIFVPTKFMAFKYRFSPQTVKVLVWGGIRGGVSIALALSIPQNQYNEIIISITYCVVVFSIVVQGLTIGKVANPKKIATEEKALRENA
ncbi:cation:proton antiporter [Chryseobacterium sp. SC28]|uniref:cation:proton antiporter n=1 Tax=Chryseobacterium sp. SC28 TaxID=2268028 RepID=UPI000F655360|nr:sodium:proton antiporter [Chryseobacterium sp. SC28]RRQ47333.1 sodium:proton antiporter [Chryseobacterium sp. SC28]